MPEDLEHHDSPGATEDEALAELKQRDLAPERIAALLREPAAAKSRKVLCAVVAHPRTPRHVALPTARKLFPFELMSVAAQPGVAPDVKRFIDELLAQRIPQLSLGERISIAKQTGGGSLAALLADADERVLDAALNNPQLTTSHLTRALRRAHSAALLVLLIRAEKWRNNNDVKMAMLFSEHLAPEIVAEIASRLNRSEIEDAIEYGDAPEATKAWLRELLRSRS